jgi:hypothetical protein
MTSLLLGVGLHGVGQHGRRHIRCAGIDEIIHDLLEVIDTILGDLIVVDAMLGLILGEDVAKGPKNWLLLYIAQTETDVLRNHLGVAFGFRTNLGEVGVERVPKLDPRVHKVSPALQNIEANPIDLIRLLP